MWTISFGRRRKTNMKWRLTNIQLYCYLTIMMMTMTSAQQSLDKNASDEDVKRTAGHNIMRFGRNQHNIMRFGRTNGHNIMHFGKRGEEDESESTGNDYSVPFSLKDQMPSSLLDMNSLLNSNMPNRLVNQSPQLDGRIRQALIGRMPSSLVHMKPMVVEQTPLILGAEDGDLNRAPGRESFYPRRPFFNKKADNRDNVFMHFG